MWAHIHILKSINKTDVQCSSFFNYIDIIIFTDEHVCVYFTDNPLDCSNGVQQLILRKKIYVYIQPKTEKYVKCFN